MLTKAAMELIQQTVGTSHEDAQFVRLLQTLPPDHPRIRFCPNGHGLAPDKPRTFACSSCGYEGDRAVTFSADTRFRIKDGDLFHYSVGAAVFCRFQGEQEDRVVLLRRATHPVGAFTVPSGRWDAGEEALVAAQREVTEETGLKSTFQWDPVSEAELIQEGCRSGSNFHLWHFYRCHARPEAADLILAGDDGGTRTGEADMIGWVPISQVSAGLFWLTRPAGHFLGKVLGTRIRHVLPQEDLCGT